MRWRCVTTDDVVDVRKTATKQACYGVSDRRQARLGTGGVETPARMSLLKERTEP